MELSNSLEQLKEELETISNTDTNNLRNDFDTLQKELDDIRRREICNSATSLNSLSAELKKINTKEFSILQTLGVEEDECVHSNFLAWLLDPLENHGLGSLFTERFLTLATQKMKHDIIDLSQISLKEMLVDREISSETSRLDIRLMDSKGLLNCTIENKILSKEGIDQTNRLYNDFHGICPNEIFIFLTLNGTEKPINQNFLSLTYTELKQIFEDLLEIATGDTKFLIKNYLNTLERLIMSEKFNGYSERTQLYYRYIKQIGEIRSAYETDRRLLLNALADEIKQREWWNESTWKMEKTGAYIRIFKPEWMPKDDGVYFFLRPWIEQPACDLQVYGKPASFSTKFAPILKRKIDLKYPGKMAGDFIKRLTGINTFLENILKFSLTEKDQVEKVLKNLDVMVDQFEKILDESIEEFKELK